jgi:hypothetical protein
MDIVEQARQRVAQMQQTVTPPPTAVSPKRASEDPLVDAACSQGGKTLAILTPGDWSVLLSLDKEIDEVWSVGVTSKLLAVTKRFPLEEYPYEAVAASLRTKYVVGELAHAVALAVHSGFAEIHVVGDPPDAAELPCVEFLLSIAIQRGAQVYAQKLLWNKHSPDALMKGKVPRDVIA